MTDQRELGRTPGEMLKSRRGMGQPQQVITNCSRNGRNILAHNNDSGIAASNLPVPAVEDLSLFTEPPTRNEVVKAIEAMKTNKAAALDCAISAEAHQEGGDIHNFSMEV